MIDKKNPIRDRFIEAIPPLSKAYFSHMEYLNGAQEEDDFPGRRWHIACNSKVREDERNEFQNER